MIEVAPTSTFTAWFERLADPPAQSRIAARILKFRLGLFGDVEPVGKGVSEARIHYGPGYRVYFVRRGRLLLGTYYFLVQIPLALQLLINANRLVYAEFLMPSATPLVCLIVPISFK